MFKKRLAGLLLILPLLLGLGVAAYRLGPNPKESNKQVAMAASSLPAPVASKPVETENAQLFELFGMYQKAVAKGRVQLTPTEYLNSLEAIYTQRGYRKAERFDPDSAPKKKRGKALRKEVISPRFFQRDDTQGIANISATGTDADYSSSETEFEPYTFSTLVVPAENGGANWATYKLGIDRNKLAQLGQLENGDFPGIDPKGIPRLPGLQRIYATASGSGSIVIYKGNQTSDTALMLRYLEEVPRYGWHLDSSATSAANQVASGVMCFTQGVRSCLIWVTPGEQTGTSSVTISCH